MLQCHGVAWIPRNGTTVVPWVASKHETIPRYALLENTGPSPSVGLMLVHRLQRWPSIKTTLSHTQFVQVDNIHVGLSRAGLPQSTPGPSLFSADDRRA